MFVAACSSTTDRFAKEKETAQETNKEMMKVKSQSSAPHPRSRMRKSLGAVSLIAHA